MGEKKSKHSANYYKSKILLVLNQMGKKPVTRNDLIGKTKCKKSESEIFKQALEACATVKRSGKPASE